MGPRGQFHTFRARSPPPRPAPRPASPPMTSPEPEGQDAARVSLSRQKSFFADDVEDAVRRQRKRPPHTVQQKVAQEQQQPGGCTPSPTHTQHTHEHTAPATAKVAHVRCGQWSPAPSLISAGCSGRPLAAPPALTHPPSCMRLNRALYPHDRRSSPLVHVCVGVYDTRHLSTMVMRERHR